MSDNALIEAEPVVRNSTYGKGGLKYGARERLKKFYH